MVMTTQSSPCKNGLRRSNSARCFCASINRSRCCCRMRFCCSSSPCCRRPSVPCMPPRPPAPSPPSCREIASRCSGERPCIICRLSMEFPKLCPLAGRMKSNRASDNASRQKHRNGRRRKGITVLQVGTSNDCTEVRAWGERQRPLTPLGSLGAVRYALAPLTAAISPRSRAAS